MHSLEQPQKEKYAQELTVISLYSKSKSEEQCFELPQKESWIANGLLSSWFASVNNFNSVSQGFQLPKGECANDCHLGSSENRCIDFVIIIEKKIYGNIFISVEFWVTNFY